MTRYKVAALVWALCCIAPVTAQPSTAVAAEAASSALQFEAYRSYGATEATHLPIVGDFNHDGKSEVVSSLQNADGTFTTSEGPDIGIRNADAPSLVKTFRVADFSGDGFDDILQVPYNECTGNTQNILRLYVNDRSGHFDEDDGFAGLGIRGRGETALAADFNNDGRVDIFIPFYNRPDTAPSCPAPAFTAGNRLLRNDSSNGVVRFTDVTAGAGITHPLNETDAGGQIIGPPEGAQSADIDRDGLVDIFAGQRLYRNLGNMRFQDYTTASGLPAPSWNNFEEGMAFIDWNGDGRLDIALNAQRGAGVVNNKNYGRIVIFEQLATCASGVVVCFGGQVSTAPNRAPAVSRLVRGVATALTTCDSFGLWGQDINNDGYEDLIVAGTPDSTRAACGAGAHSWYVLINQRAQGGGFQTVNGDLLFRERLAGGGLGANRDFGGSLMVSFADFDNDGRPDLSIFGGLVGGSDITRLIGLNRSPGIGNSLSVVVQDAGGLRNQQGRIVTATSFASGKTITRAVDGGSGYLSNGDYATMMGTHDGGPYRVSVTLPNQAGQPVEVAAVASAGQIVTFARPDAAHPGGQVDVRARGTVPPVVLGNPPIAPPTDPSRYVATTPTRLLDTRSGSLIGFAGDKPSPEQVVVVDVGSLAGGAVSAALNVTATDANGGFVTVWPCDQPRPTASSLNLTPGSTSANLVVTKLSASGTACLFSDQGTHLIVDLQGFYRQATRYTAVQPQRILDTRPDSLNGYVGAKPGAGKVTTVQVADLAPANVPVANNGVVLNLTGTDADGGFVTAYPCDAPLPRTSNLNLPPGSTRPNLLFVKASATGTVCLFNDAPTHLLVDVVGYFPVGDEYTSVQPARVFDTRPTEQIGYSGGKIAAGTWVRVAVGGQAGIPTNARQVVANVTATDSHAGFLTVFPCGQPVPTASNLNVVEGDTRPNLAIAPVVGGDICIFTDNDTHLIVDVFGWFS